MTAPAVLLSGGGNLSFATASTTSFYGMTGGFSGYNTNESRAQHQVGTAGTLSGLSVSVFTNNRTNNTTYKARNGGADAGSPSTMQAVFGSGVTGVITDSSNTVAVAVDDHINMAIATGTGTQTIFMATTAVVFTANSGTSVFIASQDGVGTGLSGTGPITDFVAVAGTPSNTVTEANAQINVPVAGTAQHMTMDVSANGRTTNTVVTLRKNGGNGTNTFTYTSAQTGAKADTTHSDALSAGDLICVSPVLGTGTGNFNITLCGITFDATTDGSSFVANGAPVGVSAAAGANSFYMLGGTLILNLTNENRTQAATGVSATGSKAWIFVSANVSTTAPVLHFRNAAADKNQNVTITALTTGAFQDTTNSDAFTAAQLVNWRLANITTSTITVNGISMQVVTGANTGLSPAAGTLTLTGLAPVLGLGLLPSAGSLAVTGNAPAMGFGLNPAAGSLALSGIAPTITIAATGISLTPGAGSLVLTGNAPSLDFGFFPSAGSLVITGLAPSLANDLGLSPGAGSLVITGVTPALANNLGLTPGAGSLILTGNAPTIGLGLNPPSGSLTLSGNAPTMGFEIFPASGTLVITGLTPSMAAGLSLFPGAGALTLTGLAPALGLGLFPGAGTLVITGVAPDSNQGINLLPAAGTLVITGNAPTLGISYFLSPPSGTLTITGVVPFGGVSYFLTPPSGSLALNGFAAHIKIRHIPIFFNPDYIYSFWESMTFDYIGYNPVSLQMFIQYRDGDQQLYFDVNFLSLQRIVGLINAGEDPSNILNGLRVVL